MRTPSAGTLRAVFAAVLLLTAGTLVASYAAADTTVADGTGPTTSTDAPGTANGTTGTGADTTDGAGGGTSTTSGDGAGNATPTSIGLESRINRSNVTETSAAGPLTVVATQGFYVSDEQAELVAFSDAGRVVYHDDTYRVYFDVDPVPGTRRTVEYIAAKHLSGDVCTETKRCTRNVVNRVNLTTGEERTVYAKVTPRIYSARWHDVDRLNATHLVVADIVNDGVYVVDTRDNRTVWRWNASRIYTRDMGGKGGDWTHVNDVEPLADGRIMVSVRNMDQVIFLERGAGPNGTWGADESWTLGADGNHDVLYEQHNPDYIPATRGGPAVLVGDSENGRVVEYQRTNGTWNRTWVWKDSRLQWPRDADRLPSGHTLIVDSHGDRVLEAEPDGDIVWSVTIGMPYDAERLGTGDESAGGRSIRAIRRAEASDPVEQGVLPSLLPGEGSGGDDAVVRPSRGPVGSFWLTLKSVTPSLVVNGLLYVAPSWVRFTDLVFAFVLLTTLLVWGGLELRWRGVPRRAVGALRARLR